MEGKGGFFVLITIVAFLSITLALLTGYVFFAGGNSSHEEEPAHSESEVKERIRPLDSDLTAEILFESKATFNLKNDDPDEINIIQLSGELIYFNNIEGIEDPLSKITLYKNEIKEIVGSYFLNKTIGEIKLPQAKKKAKKELTEQINELLNQSEEKKQEFIFNIIFYGWFYQ